MASGNFFGGQFFGGGFFGVLPSIVSTATPGFHKWLHIPSQIKGETEAAKLARRIREGTLPIPIAPVVVDAGSAYADKLIKLSAGIARFRADAEVSRKTIARLEREQRKRQTAALRKKLLHAQQALTLATVQEAVLMEEMEVLDIAFFAHTALRIVY